MRPPVRSSRQPGDLRLLEVSPHLGAQRVQHQVAQRHAFPPRELAALVDHPVDGHIHAVPHLGAAEDGDHVVVLQGRIVRPALRAVTRQRDRNLVAHGVGEVQPRDERAARVRVRLEPARTCDELREPHPALEAEAPRLIDAAPDLDEIPVGAGERIHDHAVPVRDRNARNRHAAIPVARAKGHVNRDALRPAGRPLVGREDPVDGDPPQRRIRLEASGRRDEVGEALRRLQLVNRRPANRPQHRGPGSVDRHEHNVPGLEPDVVARVAPKQVVVEIEARRDLARAPHLDVPRAGEVRHPARCVQRRQHGAEGADLVGARLRHLANHVGLDRADARHRDVEVRGGTGSALDPRIDPPQPREQETPQLIQRQARNVQLPYLRDQDEPFARDLEW